MNKKFLLLALPCFLAACNPDGASSSSPSGSEVASTPPTSTPSTTPMESVDLGTKAYQQLKQIKDSANYTIFIEDDDGDFTQYFNPEAWSYTFDGGATYDGYLEDENGLYPIEVDEEGALANAYYELDAMYEPVRGIYDNITYSLADLSLSPLCYGDEEGEELILKGNLANNADALVLFALAGYIPDDTFFGIDQVKAMSFGYDHDGNLSFTIDFLETSGRGPTVGHIESVGSTKQPTPIQTYIDNGGKGIERVPTDDPLFTYLASLKNLRNFTLEIRSDYAAAYNNYTLTSKYMANAYYSHSSRAEEKDIGYYEDEQGVHILGIDSLNGDTVIGDLVKDSQGNTFADLYKEAIFSFADTYWDYAFESQYADEGYRIDDYQYITDTAQMTDAYVFRFEISHLLFGYDEKTKEYHFDYVFTNGDHIYMDVTDIGTTQIGNLPIE